MRVSVFDHSGMIKMTGALIGGAISEISGYLTQSRAGSVSLVRAQRSGGGWVERRGSEVILLSTAARRSGWRRVLLSSSPTRSASPFLSDAGGIWPPKVSVYIPLLN